MYHCMKRSVRKRKGIRSMSRFVIGILSLIISTSSIGSQKDTIKWYMTESEYSPLFSDQLFDKENYIFKAELVNKTTENNRQQTELLNKLFHSLKSSSSINLVGSSTSRDILNRELLEIQKRYPDSTKRELLEKMNCAAASVLDDFSCGIQFWKKIKTSTFISLTANTVLMPTLVAADFLTAGASSTPRAAAKVAQKKGNKILSAVVKGYKASNAKVWSTAKALHRITRFKKLKPTKGSTAILYVVNSKPFKLTMNIVELTANISEGVASLNSENRQNLARMLNDLNGEMSSFKTNCDDRFSDDACLYFEGLDQNEISNAANVALNAGLGEIKLAIAVLDIKLITMGYALVENGIINPLTDNEDSEFFETLTETGFTLAEFTPLVGPVVAWGNSIRKTKQEMGESYSAARYEYELFSLGKSDLTSVAIARYQAAVIEDTIFAIQNSPTDIPFQLLNRDSLYPSTLSETSMFEVFGIEQPSIINYRELQEVIAERRSDCNEYQTSRISAVLFNTNYFVDTYQCDTLHFTKIDESSISIVYNLKDNTIFRQFNQVFSDIHPSKEYASAVGVLVTKGILNTNNENFYPNKNITRAEFYALIQRAFYLQSNDNISENWSLNSLNILKKKLPNTVFNEELSEPITISEAAEIAAGVTSITSTYGIMAEIHYSQPCSFIAKPLFKLLANEYLSVSKNVMSGCPYNISNTSPLTRGDTAILLANMLKGAQ